MDDVTDTGGRSVELDALLLEEHRRSHDLLLSRYRAAEAFLTWIIRTAVLVFAAIATAASIVDGTVLRRLTPVAAAVFASALVANFAAFAYAVDSLSIGGVEAWGGRAGTTGLSERHAHAWLVKQYQLRLRSLNEDVRTLEESGERAVLLLFGSIVLFFAGVSLLALEVIF